MESHKKMICMPFLGVQRLNRAMNVLLLSLQGMASLVAQHLQFRRCRLGRSPRERNGNTLRYSCLENPMDRGAQWITVHVGVVEESVWLSNQTTGNAESSGSHHTATELRKANDMLRGKRWNIKLHQDFWQRTKWLDCFVYTRWNFCMSADILCIFHVISLTIVKK